MSEYFQSIIALDTYNKINRIYEENKRGSFTLFEGKRM